MKKAITPRGKEFDKELTKSNIRIDELDKKTLNEKKYKLKRKIFSLPKMEAMVHADPRLSSIYNQMAEEGRDKYGYHYNETIMNIIFNDYVLNSPKYLQKYKNTKPAKKKRRDKFGIEQMKKQYDGADKIKSKENKKDMDETQEMTNFSRYGKGSGTIDSNMGDLNETVKSEDVKSSKRDNPKKGEFAGEKFSGKSIAKKPVDEEKEIDESTSTASAGNYQYAGPGVWSKTGKPAMRRPFWVGGTVIGESNYLIESEGFKNYYKLLNEDMNTTIKEHHKDDKDGQIDFILKNINNIKDLKEVLSKLSEKEVKRFYDELEKDMGLIDETETSLIDQNPSTMANKPQPVGDLGNSVEMGVSSMNEHHLDTREEKIDYVCKAFDIIINQKFFDDEKIKTILMKKSDDEIHSVYLDAEKKLKEKGIDPKSINIQENDNTIKTVIDSLPHKNDTEIGKVARAVSDELNENLQYTVEYDSDRSGENPFDLKGVKWQFVNAIYPDGKKDIGVYRFDHDLVYDYEWWRENFIDNMPMGKTFDVEGLDEIDTLLKETEKVLEEISYHKKTNENMKKVNEDKKTPSMVNRDRLAKENQKNFKSDLQISGTKEAIEAQKDLQHKDQQTEVSNPKKFSEDIEKDVLKTSGGEALENNGDSTADGKHIPKRNHTRPEQEEVDLTRKGMQDWQYDNDPGKKFEERMKDGMGEELYKQRQEKMKRNAKAPTYNKDTQPVTDGDEKEQFNKFKNESVITGLYFNDLGKRKLIDFQLNEVNMVSKIDESWHKLGFDGLGNTYNSRVEINESIVKDLKNNNFYVNDNKEVFSIKKSNQINESEEKGIRIDENALNKMKHLLGYNPKVYTDTKSTKINRGF